MRKAQEGFGIFLTDGILIEVNMQAVPSNIEGYNSQSCYPACLVNYNIAEKEAFIYMLHDTTMTVFAIPIDQIVKATLPRPEEFFKVNEIVEVQYRVSVTDEYGWWSATIIEYNSEVNQYAIRWKNSVYKEWVAKVRVRKAAFK